MGSHFEEKDVKTAKLTATINSIEKGVANIELVGESFTDAVGVWNTKEHEKNTQTTRRGYKAKLLGKAEYNLAQQKFISFEMVACGTRWGTTEFNFRKDLEESNIGTVFVMAGKSEEEKVAPVFWNDYNWQSRQLKR